MSAGASQASDPYRVSTNSLSAHVICKPHQVNQAGKTILWGGKAMNEIRSPILILSSPLAELLIEVQGYYRLMPFGRPRVKSLLIPDMW
jgi:hypothetical protein